MADGTFQVIFSGEIIAGADLDMVKGNVARIFKLDAGRVDQLFCGRRLILKKAVDQATAGKYKATMQRAGAVCEIEDTATVAAPAAISKIDSPPAVSSEPTTTSAADDAGQADVDATGLSIAEVGITLVEHKEVPVANIDTGDLDMDDVGVQLVEHQEVPEANIDTGDLDMDDVGVQLVEHQEVPEASIDTGDLDMDDVGVQLAEHNEVPVANIDTGDMDMDEVGVQLVESRQVPEANINTSNLSLSQD